MSADTSTPAAPHSQASADAISPGDGISPVDLTICHLKSDPRFTDFRDVIAAVKDIHGAAGTKCLGNVKLTKHECERRWQDAKAKFEAQTNAKGEWPQYKLVDLIKAATKVYNGRYFRDLADQFNLRLASLGRESDSVDAKEVLNLIQQQDLKPLPNRGGSKQHLIQAAMASCDRMSAIRRWWTITNPVNFVLEQFGRSITLVEVRILGDPDFNPTSEVAEHAAFEDPAIAMNMISGLRKEKAELVRTVEALMKAEVPA